MLDDFEVPGFATEGTRWTRRLTGVIGALLGGGVGYGYHLLMASTGWAAAGQVVIPALTGAVLSWLFSGFVLLGIVVVLGVGIAIGWNSLFGT